MSTTISRHPDDANLLSFAAGTLPEPLAAVVASHVALCPRCRKEMRALDALGGLLLMRTAAGEAGAAPVRPQAVEREAVIAPARIATPDRLPGPIAARYGLSLHQIPWRRLGPGVLHHRLPLSPGVEGDLRLLKITAGRRMPEHGHGGTEMTLVLDGAFRDATGRYGPGDVQDVDGDLEHQPTVEPGGDCICLVASEHPARFKGLFSRLLQPWTGM